VKRQRTLLARVSTVFALSLLFFSTGVVASQQCHAVNAPVAATHADHAHSHPDIPLVSDFLVKPEIESNSPGLFAKACIGFFFLVLLIGQGVKFKKAARDAGSRHSLVGSKIVFYRKPLNLSLALTLPQLGLIRI
jgi:hypothetical protein